MKETLTFEKREVKALLLNAYMLLLYVFCSAYKYAAVHQFGCVNTTKRSSYTHYALCSNSTRGHVLLVDGCCYC